MKKSLVLLRAVEVFGIAKSLAKDQFSLYHGTKSHIVDPFTAMSVKPSFEGKTAKLGFSRFMTLLNFCTMKYWICQNFSKDVMLLLIDILLIA